jgi:sodium-dependent dicarboxylate transporter 2/3/5
MIESQLKVKIPFFQWMLLAVPILAAMCVFLFGLLWFTNRPELRRIEGCREYVRREVERLGPWTRGQVNTLVAFLVTVVLWTIPGVLSVAAGTESDAYRGYAGRIPESVAALLGAILLFVLPVHWKRREFTLSWSQAVRIDWGTLILFGAGISLGNLMFKTGLAEVVGESLLELGGVHSVWGITLAAVAITVVVSEATSNTAAANMVIPVTISLAIAAGADPIPPALGATLGASWGFMLPVATPPNAIVYGSGLIPITKMIRAGFFFDVGGVLIIWTGLRILLPILGLSS